MESDPQKPRVVVVGAGYVGLATAVALRQSQDGLVVVVDQSETRILSHQTDLVAHRDPLGEPGMADALRDRVLLCTQCDYRDAIVFVCVGTPSNEFGGIDGSAVEEVAHQALDAGARLVVIRSTVTPQFVRRLLDEVRDGGPGRTARIAVAPEFLREGHAVDDATFPGRIVVGAEDEETALQVLQLVRARCRHTASTSEFHRMTAPEAALVKLASNGMLSLRAWFANAIADTCEAIPGADAARVLAAVGADRRIGAAHLSPGLGVGGPCLPKDASALARSVSSFAPLQDLVDHMTANPVWRLSEQIRRRRPTGSVLIVGVGFKPDSPDWRHSPAVDLVSALIAQGVQGRAVTLWDPRLSAIEAIALLDFLRIRCGRSGQLSVSTLSVAPQGPHEVLVWAYRDNLPASPYDTLSDTALVVDPYRLVPPVPGMSSSRFEYLGRGLGPTAEQIAADAVSTTARESS